MQNVTSYKQVKLLLEQSSTNHNKPGAKRDLIAYAKLGVVPCRTILTSTQIEQFSFSKEQWIELIGTALRYGDNGLKEVVCFHMPWFHLALENNLFGSESIHSSAQSSSDEENLMRHKSDPGKQIPLSNRIIWIEALSFFKKVMLYSFRHEKNKNEGMNICKSISILRSQLEKENTAATSELQTKVKNYILSMCEKDDINTEISRVALDLLDEILLFDTSKTRMLSKLLYDESPEEEPHQRLVKFCNSFKKIVKDNLVDEETKMLTSQHPVIWFGLCKALDSTITANLKDLHACPTEFNAQKERCFKLLKLCAYNYLSWVMRHPHTALDYHSHSPVANPLLYSPRSSIQESLSRDDLPTLVNNY